MTAAVPAARRAEIIEAVASGLRSGKPLTIICDELQAQGPFTQQSVYNWLRNDPEAKEAIAFARLLGFDWIAHETLAIADDTSQDVIYDGDGTPHANGAAVLRAKVRIETRLKLLARWDSTRYGDTKTMRVEGEVTQTTRHVLDPRQLDDAGRAALRHLIEHAAAQGLLAEPDDEPQEAEFVDVSDDQEPA
jgi:Bacteriophage Sf6, terminase small subunit-like